MQRYVIWNSIMCKWYSSKLILLQQSGRPDIKFLKFQIHGEQWIMPNKSKHHFRRVLTVCKACKCMHVQKGPPHFYIPSKSHNHSSSTSSSSSCSKNWCDKWHKGLLVVQTLKHCALINCYGGVPKHMVLGPRAYKIFMGSAVFTHLEDQ